MIGVRVRPCSLIIEGHSPDALVCAAVSALCELLRPRAAAFADRKFPAPSCVRVDWDGDPPELIVEVTRVLRELAVLHPGSVSIAP